ncbi:DUF418 domain-containing protein [Actinopolymorpha sp. B9G3]|uniref:DUF418 domain-containing protein n=1 Tax=Actinopolymorpha sp. B9G3 TaxID=3158970 RepID=UPI0032D97711
MRMGTDSDRPVGADGPVGADRPVGADGSAGTDGRGARGPVTRQERALAPDLARGVMLAFIALANAPLFLYDRPRGPRLHVIDTGLVDRIASFVVVTFVDGRAYPMFAALFGYGMVQLYRRQRASGSAEPAIRRVQVRRNLWLLVFGIVHAALLFPGDILGGYGLAGLFMLALLPVSDRGLLAWAAVCTVPVVVLGSTYGLATGGGGALVGALSTQDPWEAMSLRLADWLATTPFTALMVLLPMVLGLWAGRRRILDEPERHRVLLRRAAVAGLTLALAGGLPLDLVVVGVQPSSSVTVNLVYGALHTLTGVAGGLGYAALVGLLAARLQSRWARQALPGQRREVAPGRITTAVAACGERSLSCYLAQSVVFVLLFTPYAGGLGAHLGSAATAGVALLTWLAIVAGAGVLGRVGRRGPAEVLLRSLTYRAPRGNR